MAMEAAGDHLRTALVAPGPFLTAADILQTLAWQEGELRKCQAVDAFSRSQWLALIRRSLVEGEAETGVAAELLSPVVGSPCEKTVASEVSDRLRRDARQRHEMSMLLLLGPSDWRLALIPVEERAAYLQTLQRLHAARQDASAEMFTLPGWLPEGRADPAEVGRIASEIAASCPVRGRQP